MFLAEKCHRCHSVSSAGIKAAGKKKRARATDLTGVGPRLGAQFLLKFLKRGVKKKGELHSKLFKGTDEELQALVDWLLEQKAEG